MYCTMMLSVLSFQEKISKTYFQELLSTAEDQLPVIFFRDVSFSEMEALVEYIYTGEVEVPGASLQSFLSLAHSLGVSGFSQENENKTPTKRKLEWGVDKPKDRCKELKDSVSRPPSISRPPSRVFSQPCTPTKTRSEPASLVETALQCSNSKKRKLQTQSLTDDLENIDPYLLNLARPVKSREEVEGHDKPQKSSHKVERSVSTLIKLKASNSPLKDQGNHAPSSSCPVPPSPSNPSSSAQSAGSGHSSNFSFDSHFLDPDELAAKGATLLHHLAVWMIQQRKDNSSHDYQRYIIY